MKQWRSSSNEGLYELWNELFSKIEAKNRRKGMRTKEEEVSR